MYNQSSILVCYKDYGGLMELPHQGKQTYEEPKVYALEPPHTNEPAALGFLEMEGWTKKNYDRSLKQGNSIPRITIKLKLPISGKCHRSSISAEHKRPRRTDVCHICVSVDTMSQGSVPWDPSDTSTGSCGWSD